MFNPSPLLILPFHPFLPPSPTPSMSAPLIADSLTYLLTYLFTSYFRYLVPISLPSYLLCLLVGPYSASRDERNMSIMQPWKNITKNHRWKNNFFLWTGRVEKWATVTCYFVRILLSLLLLFLPFCYIVYIFITYF